MSLRSQRRGLSADPVWQRLTSWERPLWLIAAVANGTADIICPRCGRAEKFSRYCTLCYYPIQLSDIRIHTPGDTHSCVFKRVPPDAVNGGWGDSSVSKWTPEEGIVDSSVEPAIRIAQAQAARDEVGLGDVLDAS